jgi:hypothetical protein
LIQIGDPGWKKFGSGMGKIGILRDGKNSDPGSGMEKIRIRDKHPGSATSATLLTIVIQKVDQTGAGRVYRYYSKESALSK